MIKIELEYPDSKPCTCDECKLSCKHPCWPTPVEAESLIASGYGKMLMADYWAGDGPSGEDIMVLCPASPKYGGNKAPWDPPQNGCVMQEINGNCILHDPNLKPIEGRFTRHDVKNNGLHEAVAMEWNTDKGRAVYLAWAAQYLNK